MKLNTAYVQGLLAIAGLTASYFTWQRAPEAPVGEVTMVDLKASQVKALKYLNASHQVLIQKEDTEKGLIEIEGKKYLAGDAVKTLFERLSPMSASRDLGILEEKKLKEFGLSDSRKKLEWATGKKVLELKIGLGAAGFGGTYVLSGQNQHVYLTSNPALSELDNAQTRLVDRRLHVFNASEVDRIKITLGMREYDLVPSGAFPKIKVWHDSVWRLTPLYVFGKEEAPIQGNLETQFKVAYFGKDKALGNLELASAGNDLFVRSEHTLGWMKIQAGTPPLLQQITELVSTEPTLQSKPKP